MTRKKRRKPKQARARTLWGLSSTNGSPAKVVKRCIFGCNHESHEYANATNSKGFVKFVPSAEFILSFEGLRTGHS